MASASTDPAASGPLGLQLLAIGDAEVARQVRQRLQEGTLIDGLVPLDVPLVGVGHSIWSTRASAPPESSSGPCNLRRESW